MIRTSIITILLAIVWATGQSQTFTPVVEDSIDFVITGSTTSPHDSVAMFPCAPDGDMMMFPIVGGKFKVTGRLPRHTFIQIGDNIGNDLCFIVEETPIDINLVTGEVTGSELQQRFIRCQMREREINKIFEPWWNRFSDEEKDRIYTLSGGGLADATAEDSINLRKLNQHMDDLSHTRRQIIQENLDNIIPAWYLNTGMGSLTLEQLQEIMHEDAPYASLPAMEGPWMAYNCMLRQATNKGKSAPDFETEAPDGTKHHLSEYTGRGKYVLIDFWASWCGLCIASIPFMKELYATYKDRNIVFLGVSCDKDRDAWLKALEKHQLPWISMRSPSGMDDAINLYGVDGVPTVILIDPVGNVISTGLGGNEVKTKLIDIFGE